MSFLKVFVKDSYLMVVKNHLSLMKEVRDQHFLINLQFFLNINEGVTILNLYIEMSYLTCYYSIFYSKQLCFVISCDCRICI